MEFRQPLAASPVRFSKRLARNIIIGGGESKMATMTTATLTIESLLDSVSHLSSVGKRRLAVELLKTFDSRAILEILRQITPADSNESAWQLPEPVTDEEKEAYAIAKALGLHTDDGPGGQTLNRMAAILHKSGVTYDELMAEVEKNREKTIRLQFPNLEPIHREGNPDGPPLS
jgi:hypothetical protein